MNMKVLKKMLEKMGFVPECAYDGAQAISKYTENPDYGLILMDLHMPVMDGLTVCTPLPSLLSFIFSLLSLTLFFPFNRRLHE